MSTLDEIMPISVRVWWTVAGFLALLGLWLGVSHSGLIEARMLPGPETVASTILRLMHESFAGSTLQEHLVSSLGRYLLGFGLAVLIGIPLGLMMGWFEWLDDLVTPFFEMLRFIAPISWVPFAVLWFGTGIGGPLLIIFSGAFPPCLINAYRGAKMVDKRLIEAVRTLGASNYRVIKDVLLPGSLPSIVTGVRLSAGIGWQSLIGAELIVVSSGIGYLMVQGQANFATDIVMAGMITIGCIGLLIDFSLRVIEQSISRKWSQGGGSQ
ncbi:ABC transporter permease [Paracoccus aerius]|uniref:ABC transporter permease n=1 Tax=Paracoccus aerius TaxID=1915382 RepID=A0ABS1SAI9_9RHOB|nr:ABC transporter permease [Paracoccus aerius]MBL3675766.1 ABC transporter permease [Paracoccus aerius]GHG37052.1 taurine ABC transporter permease [Paracoccus aerius]